MIIVFRFSDLCIVFEGVSVLFFFFLRYEFEVRFLFCFVRGFGVLGRVRSLYVVSGMSVMDIVISREVFCG